ncbi:MAG: hypothetical protein IKO49_08050 [Bacilli bacterium]|nr:hypothetical protein [Bacilli bacterium]
MDENIELLEIVYKNAEMGSFTINKLLKELEDKENKIKKLAKEELDIYEQYKDESEELIKKYDYDLEKNKLTSKIMSSMGISKEVKSDNSDSSIAHMLTEGITMGIVDMETKIDNYKDVVEKDILKLAKKFLKFQQEEIEKLKEYM